ncbi:HNH endonuclease [Geobacter anodireducens]
MDENRLAAKLSAQFLLGLTGCSVPPASGILCAFRATDIPSPNGFTIQVKSGWKSIEAEFVPDTYAGELIRAMGHSTAVAKESFISIAKALDMKGTRITTKVNDSMISLASALPPPPWNKFALNVRRLTDAVSGSADELQGAAEAISTECLALILAVLPVEEDDSGVVPCPEGGLPEGACIRVLVNKYERNPANRAACIAVQGLACKICGFNFSSVYGPMGDGFVEVHHLVPVSRMGQGYIVDPVKDLIPICSNCHSMLHRTDPPMEPEVLSRIYNELKSGRQSLFL